MKSFSIIPPFILLAAGQTTQKVKTNLPYSAKDKTAEEYTTADSEQLKLSVNGEASYKDVPQPSENQRCVFIDPGKTKVAEVNPLAHSIKTLVF